VRFDGSVTIAAPRERVWSFLTDPEAVSGCAPGLESLEVLAPGERFRAVVSAGFGSVRVRFEADVEWLDLSPPERARMKAHGIAPGSAVDAASEMRLFDAEEGGRTRLDWEADVTVVGAIASLAARLMSGVARRLTDAFFDEVRQRIESREVAAPSERFGPAPLEEAIGAILARNVSGGEGTPLFRKGRVLTAEDVSALRAHGRTRVYVARPRPGDIHEDAAAGGVAHALIGPGLRASGPSAGRVNLMAELRGVVRVDAARLEHVNRIPGVTAATLPDGTAVTADQMVATVKIIPFAIPEESLEEVQTIAGASGPLLRLDPLPERRVALLLGGAPAARERVERQFADVIRTRVEGLGSRLESVEYLALDEEGGEEGLAAAISRLQATGVDLVVLAGETAVVDAEDIAPRAIRRAGGTVTAFGAPVDPGNLLLVAYVGSLPVLGAPGCARSPRPNVMDLVLPRLLAGERLDQAALAALGHGGLLEDVPERPMPRSPL
jgi:carbon monoxide dehydrogenase subunit G/molybdopterin biosynthesis enzyme